MDAYLIWNYAHILIFVLWLGAEAGVFAAMQRVKDPRRDVAERKALIVRAQSLKRIPRACLALILPTGLQMTTALGIYPMTPGALAFGWALGLMWLFNTMAISHGGHPILILALKRLQVASQGIAGLILTVVGLNSLATSAPFPIGWFTMKVLLYGLVFWSVIAADLLYRPFRAPFEEICQEGSAPEREEAVSRALNNSLGASVVVYVLVILIAYFGAVKPA